eukprot:14453545-Alexandrium_andersonii.AAC.1
MSAAGLHSGARTCMLGLRRSPPTLCAGRPEWSNSRDVTPLTEPEEGRGPDARAAGRAALSASSGSTSAQ